MSQGNAKTTKPAPGNNADSTRPIVRLSGITRHYPGVHALKGVDFDVFAGEIHCLVGENGAGKSTLMRVMTGATQPHAGVIEIDGQAVNLQPATAIAHGIGIVYQELDLIPALSIAENIFLGHEPLKYGRVIDRVQLEKQTAALLDTFGLNIPPSTRVRNLAPAQQQMVQIAKALSHNNRVLILDEPTASLTDNETERLFLVLRRLRAQGLGLVYISHRLEEVLALADRISVFRDGSNVFTSKLGDMTQADIIKAMVGRDLGKQFPRSARRVGSEALAVEGLTRSGEFHDISFRIMQGEVLALAGIVGAGRSELLETIFGIRRAVQGSIRLYGMPVNIDAPRTAIRMGIGLVPEERRESGLVLGRSVQDNMVYPVLDRIGSHLYLKSSQMTDIVNRLITRLSIRTPSVNTRAGGLSGGNQQKVVIGKWLAADIKVLLLDEPTRGVDVGAKAEIYQLIDELAQSGVAVLVASSELPEVLGISDRILVLCKGRQMALLETATTNQVEIMHYALGSQSAGDAPTESVEAP